MKLLGGPAILSLLISVLALAITSASAAALPIPNVEFIPDMVSENGSFLMVVDPLVYDKSVRVTWNVPGITDTHIGLFPREGDRWVCYFSNDDKDANCGPTPFASRFGDYDILVKSVDSYGETGNRSFDNFEVGAIKLTPMLTPTGAADVSIVIYPSGGIPIEVLYAVYDSDFNKKVDYTQLEMDPNTGYFKGKASLSQPGIYYFAFKTDDQSDSFGGALQKQVVGGGGYVSGVVEADSVILNLLLYSNQTYLNQGNQMTNAGDSNMTNIGVVVDRAIADWVSVIPEKSTLRPGESGYFTVKLDRVQSRMDVVTYANITSGGNVVGQIFLSLNVSVLGACGAARCPDCPVCGGGDFTIEPAIWEADYQVGDTPTQTFTITNTGDSVLVINDPGTGGLGTIVEFTTGPAIPPGGTGNLGIELSPSTSGSYSGVIEVKTSQGSQNVFVNTNFYSDVSEDISYAQDDLLLLADTGISSSILDDIESELIQAESDLAYGDYKGAANAYASAATKVGLLTDVVSDGYVPSGNGPATPTDGDSSGIIIILLIALAALGGAFVYLKKFRKGGIKFGGDEDEDLEEELGAEEEGY